MSVEELCAFYDREIADAKENDILLSLVSALCLPFASSVIGREYLIAVCF